jgi:serine/threonine protein kinase
MGSVYLAERADGRFQRQVAVKLLDPGFTLSREAGALAKLDHPNIARILDAGCAPDGRHYLVLQYVEGQALSATTLASPEGTAHCFLALTKALAHAHERGILHRDIKPSNVLMNAQGEPILIDFSAATDSKPNAPDSTKTMYRAWTPSFASPEQLAGEAGTAQSDIYSLGLLLRSVLNGTDPSPLEVDLRRVAGKASEELPALRYASATEMAEDLEAALSRKPTLAQRPRRHRAWAQKLKSQPHLLPFTLLLLAFAAALGVAWKQQREQEMERRIRALASISSPAVSDSLSDDPLGINRRALLGGIEEWSKLREEYGPQPSILAGLYMVTQGYGLLLMGPTSSRIENLDLALPYLQEAARLSDSLRPQASRVCEALGHRTDARIALANAYLSGNQLANAQQRIDEARAIVGSLPESKECSIVQTAHSLELEAVASRILFAQKRWDEVIPIRREIVLRREALAQRAVDESWPNALSLRVSTEHSRTSLGWALHYSGESSEGYKQYDLALSNLETLHRRAPSMRAITFRLAKFHREAAEIAASIQDRNLEALHLRRAKEFQDAFSVH